MPSEELGLYEFLEDRQGCPSLQDNIADLNLMNLRVTVELEKSGVYLICTLCDCRPQSSITL